MWSAEGSRSLESTISLSTQTAQRVITKVPGTKCVRPNTEIRYPLPEHRHTSAPTPSITGVIIESLKPGVLVLVCSMHINCNRRGRSEHPS